MSRILPDFSKLRIMIVGDVMIDRYLSGQVDRISPEAPVPVILLENEENRLGGAANVALNIAALGAEPIIISVIGDDANGMIFKDVMQQHQLRTDGLLVSGERQTTLKTRVIAQHQQLLRADREDTFDLSQDELKKSVELFDSILETEQIDLIILQDYNKGFLSLPKVEAVLKKAQEHNIPVSVDPKKDNFWAYKNVDLFKPNLREIRAQLDFPVAPTLESLDRANEVIKKQLGNKQTMITLASHGVYVNDGEKSNIYPTQARQIMDVSGAGDSVISVASCGLAAGMPLEELAILANLAGGQVIEKPGVVAIDLKQLQQEYKQL